MIYLNLALVALVDPERLSEVLALYASAFNHVVESVVKFGDRDAGPTGVRLMAVSLSDFDRYLRQFLGLEVVGVLGGEFGGLERESFLFGFGGFLFEFDEDERELLL